jgi:hypothetical protein
VGHCPVWSCKFQSIHVWFGLHEQTQKLFVAMRGERYSTSVKLDRTNGSDPWICRFYGDDKRTDHQEVRAKYLGRLHAIRSLVSKTRTKKKATSTIALRKVTREGGEPGCTVRAKYLGRLHAIRSLVSKTRTKKKATSEGGEPGCTLVRKWRYVWRNVRINSRNER